MQSLAHLAIRHRWWTIAAWVAAVTLANVAAMASGGSAYDDQPRIPGSESQRVADILEAADLRQENNAVGTMVLHVANGSLANEPAGFIVAARDAACADPATQVASITTPWGAASCDGAPPSRAARADMLSPDASVALVEVGYTTPEASEAAIQAAYAALSPLRTDALQIEFTGQAFKGAGTKKPALAPEMLGLIAAVIILAFVLRTLGTTLLPLVSALVALGGGFGLVPLVSRVITTPSWAVPLMTLMVIGVGIDYALFIVTRHRRNLRDGMDVTDAIAHALDTSGRAVLFAGATVCIALLGLCALGISMLYGAAIATAIGVALTVLASLTLLPALLSFLGRRALPRSLRDPLPSDRRVKLLLCTIPPLCVVFWAIYGLERLGLGGRRHRADAPARTSFWYAWSALVQRHAFAFGGIATMLLLVLSIPFLSLRAGEADPSNDPAGSTTRVGYDLIQEAFGPGHNSNLQLVLSGPRAGEAQFQQQVTDALARVENVDAQSIATVPVSDTVSLVAFSSLTGPQDAATSDLVRSLRADALGDLRTSTDTSVYVYGETAVLDDFSATISAKIPYFFVAVIGLSALLLAVVFRSIAIPLTGAIMNLLAAGASFGIVVGVFQFGWLGGLLGTGTGGPISAALPVLFFAILFGLSMDYQVFLVSRIHEEYTHTRDTTRAVNVGLGETGGIITAAGLIMIAVFAGFIFDPERILQMIGLGLAGAIVLDAFIVRTMLVPAVMQVLGDANWWYPSWLERITPRFTVEAPATPTPATRDRPSDT